MGGKESKENSVGVKQYGHPKFNVLLQEIGELHSRKNHDYAGDDPLSNLKACVRLGQPPWLGCLVRMQDKMARLEQYAKTGEFLVKDESVGDTLRDLAVYSLLCRILCEEAEELGPLAEPGTAGFGPHSIRPDAEIGPNR